MLKCFFCSLRLTIKCNGVFGFVCTENTRKRLKASKNYWIRVACRFELFQFPSVANWNFSFAHTHMELQHAVTTHQWTWKPVYYNYNIFFLQLIYFLITGQWKIMKLKQCSINIKGFFYVWFFIFTFPSRCREFGVDSLYCGFFK